MMTTYNMKGNKERTQFFSMNQKLFYSVCSANETLNPCKCTENFKWLKLRNYMEIFTIQTVIRLMILLNKNSESTLWSRYIIVWFVTNRRKRIWKKNICTIFCFTWKTAWKASRLLTAVLNTKTIVVYSLTFI